MREKKKFFTSYYFLLIVTLLVKLPFLFTHHLQEDSYITWNVAQNLLDYGVIGFNGEEPISASTTHLYVFVAAFFQWISGPAFIYVMQIVNSFLFALGSLLIASVLFKERKKVFISVLLLNLLPPSIMASVLGMEYGILFFLYGFFIRYAVTQKKDIFFLLVPILLIWTRLDTVIFLGIFGVVHLISTRKINLYFLLGGILGLGSVLIFNYWYFGDIVNHTIIAKKIAYPNQGGFDFSLFIKQLAYYGGYLKISGGFSVSIFYTYLVASILLVLFLVKTEVNKDKLGLLLTLVVFSLVKTIIFVSLKAYFDWYYWLPRVFMALIWIYFFVEYLLKTKLLVVTSLTLFLGFAGFQFLQSLGIGYMENTQRMQIVRDLQNMNANNKESIVLEPAGKIPFYTRLKTWDEVGLVDKKMTNEMLADFDYAWINLINNNHPTYILTIGTKAGEGALYKMSASQKSKFEKEYQLIKEYPIKEVHKNAPYPISIVYSIRPIGKDYYLYKKR